MKMKKQHILSDLDLEPIIIKAIDTEEGRGWSLDFEHLGRHSGESRKQVKKIIPS